MNDSSSESSDDDNIEPVTESPKLKPLKKGSWKAEEKKRLMVVHITSACIYFDHFRR